MNPVVTILMPTYNAEAFLERTLETVLAQDFLPGQTEILILDGMSTDRTRDIVERQAKSHPHIRLIDNPRRLQPFGLNIGIQQARGEFIVRMDSHTLYAPDYVSQCVELLRRGDAAEVGGVQQAVGTNYVTNAIALAMSFPFGVGNARFRYTDREIYAETVYLGAWKRSTLIELGGFLNEVNEEGDLNYRLRAAGHRILVSPKIRLKYIVRGSLMGLARQYTWYGRARVQTLTKYPDSILYRQLFPPLLLIALLISAAVVFFSPTFGLIVPVMYVGADVLASALLSIRKGLKFFPAFLAVFAILHLAWAVGFFAGMAHFGVPRIRLNAVWESIRGKSLAAEFQSSQIGSNVMPEAGGKERLNL